jgi:DNA invertase Pin-like site-specific DNA recombinase
VILEEFGVTDIAAQCINGAVPTHIHHSTRSAHRSAGAKSDLNLRICCDRTTTLLEGKRAAGCAKVYAEKTSGKGTGGRVELAKALERLAKGDVLIVTRLDRLARSTRDLLNILHDLGNHGVGFRSLADASADTTTAHGRLMLTVLAGIAEFERKLINARTGEGRARAKARGVRFGRPPGLMPISSRRLSSGLPKARRRPILRVHTAWELRQSIAWQQAAFFPQTQGREAAEEMSKRLTRQQLETMVKPLDQKRAAGEWSPAHGQYDEAFYRLTGIRRVFSSADADVIDQVMATAATAVRRLSIGKDFWR